MTSWHIETDFVAITIFIVLFIKAQVTNRQKNFTDKMFILSIALGILSTIIDVYSSTQMNYLTNWWAEELSLIAYAISTPLLTIVWLIYTLSLIFGENERKTRRYIVLLLIPYFLYIFIAVTNPLHELLFSLTADMEYSRGPLFFILGVGSQMFYAMIGFVLTLFNWKNIEQRSTAVLLLALYVGTSASYGIQLAFPGWLIICSAYAVAFLICDATFESQRRERLYQTVKQSLDETKHANLQLNQLNEELRKQIAITSAISQVYFSTYSIDLERDTFREITANEKVRRILGSKGAARETWQIICDSLTAPSSSKTAKTFLDLSTLNARMRDKKVISCEYLDVDFGWVRSDFIEQERGADGSLKKVIFAVTQIGEEKEKELEDQRKLETAVQEANSANRAKSDFLSRMSHDIRTPLNGIRGMIEIIHKNRHDDCRVDDCMKKIEISAGYLLSLISDVLEMSKLESGEVVLEHEPFDIRKIIEECRTIIAPLAASSNIRLIEDPVEIAHPYLIGSPLHLKQALINILGNGIKYNRPGGAVYLTVDELPADDSRVCCRFVIRDTGIGISEGYMQHLFEPFSQEHGGSRSTYEGTGLGLAIVHKITVIMGGEITVQSKVDEGSCFTLTLPFQIDPTPPLPSGNDVPQTTLKLEGKKILLVEDNDLNREIAEFMLEDIGIVVDSAENGQIAVDKFEHSQPNEYAAILMDIMMPVMDGLMATRMIRSFQRADAQTIPIIAMTANAFAEDAQKCREAGMNEHFPKPLDFQALAHVLESYISRTSARTE